MINLPWLELPMSRTNFHVPKVARTVGSTCTNIMYKKVNKKDMVKGIILLQSKKICGSHHAKMCLQEIAESKGLDQLAHSRSLINAVAIRLLSLDIIKCINGEQMPG